jgi:hypothetical protein
MALLARWRADQLAFTDTAGTTSAANGDAVAAWEIFEGSQQGNLATQDTSGNRPTWNSDDGGYPSVSVDGSLSQRLDLAHAAPWALTEFSWLSVVRITNASNRHIWGRGGAWSNAGAFLDRFANASAQEFRNVFFHTSYLIRFTALPKPDVTNTTWFAVSGTADGNKIECFINRQSVARVSQTQAVNFGTNPLTFFGDGSGSSIYHMTGAAREFAFWDTALAQSEMKSEIDAAMTRWDISNTVAVDPGGTAGFTGIRAISRRLGT